MCTLISNIDRDKCSIDCTTVFACCGHVSNKIIYTYSLHAQNFVIGRVGESIKWLRYYVVAAENKSRNFCILLLNFQAISRRYIICSYSRTYVFSAQCNINHSVNRYTTRPTRVTIIIIIILCQSKIRFRI